MRKIPYYSVRTGKVELSNIKLDLSELKKLILNLYIKFLHKDYFHEQFGYDCVDLGSVAGKLGDSESISLYLLRKMRKKVNL